MNSNAEVQLEAFKNRILSENKNVELIFVTGSYIFGGFNKHSDIDLCVLTEETPKQEVSYDIIENNGKRLMSAYFKKTEDALKSLEQPDEKQWAVHYYNNAKILYDKNKTMRRIKKRLKEAKKEDFLKKEPYELVGLLEYLCKLKNAFRKKDHLNVLYSSRVLAKSAHNLLKPLNQVFKYKTEKETFSSYLSLKNKPKHFNEDFKTCYGITKRTDKQIRDAGIRLALETVRYIKKKSIIKKVKHESFRKAVYTGEAEKMIQEM